jgi:hypothetical protein
MYGNPIDLKFKGYLPIGDYVKQGEFNTFKDTVKTGLQSALKEQENGIIRITNNLQPKGDYITLSQFNTYTKDTDTKISNLYTFAGKTEETIREFNQLKTGLKPAFEEIEGRVKRDYITKEDFSKFITGVKPAFEEIEGRMQKNYLTKDEFEDFKSRLYNWSLTVQNNNQSPLTNYGISIKGAPQMSKSSPASYLRHRNYMFY